MKKIAFITGIAGQDGSYLAEYLLTKNYEVHGIVRRNSITEHQKNRIQGLREDIEKLQKGNDLNIRKMYSEASKINRKINSQTDFVIIIKFIENELKYLNIIKDLDPQRKDIAVESIEKNTKLLDLKEKFNTLLTIKEKEEKIKRISYLP